MHEEVVTGRCKQEDKGRQGRGGRRKDCLSLWVHVFAVLRLNPLCECVDLDEGGISFHHDLKFVFEGERV